MGKYVVILVVALLAAHLLLSRTRDFGSKATTVRSLRRTLESTVRKTAVAVGCFIAVLAVILLVKHLTS